MAVHAQTTSFILLLVWSPNHRQNCRQKQGQTGMRQQVAQCPGNMPSTQHSVGAICHQCKQTLSWLWASHPPCPTPLPLTSTTKTRSSRLSKQPGRAESAPLWSLCYVCRGVAAYVPAVAVSLSATLTLSTFDASSSAVVGVGGAAVAVADSSLAPGSPFSFSAAAAASSAASRSAFFVTASSKLFLNSCAPAGASRCSLEVRPASFHVPR